MLDISVYLGTQVRAFYQKDFLTINSMTVIQKLHIYGLCYVYIVNVKFSVLVYSDMPIFVFIPLAVCRVVLKL